MPYLMKGKHWSERSTFRRKLQYPVFVEPKADEIRVQVVVAPCGNVKYLSYAEKPLYNLEFADETFRRLTSLMGQSDFDCGFTCNGSFDDARSFVRSSKNFPERLRNSARTFYLYDLPRSTWRYANRRGLIENAIEWSRDTDIPYLDKLPAYVARSEDDVLEHYSKFRENGWEGAMVKDMNHLYQVGKRSQDWLKLKPEETADGKIIGFVEATATVNNLMLDVRVGDKLGRVGSVIVQLEDGSEARPHGIAHELGAEMLANPSKYLGEWCEFAFMERDTQGGYRHPVFRRIRDPKD